MLDLRTIKDPGPYGLALLITGSLTLTAYAFFYVFAFHPWFFFLWIVLIGPALVLLPQPPVFFVLALYWPISKLLSFAPRWQRRLFGVLLTIVVMIAVPVWIGAEFAEDAREIISNDKLTKPQIGRPPVLALVAARGSEARVSYKMCGDFCQRVLLNKLAESVAIFKVSSLAGPLRPELRGSLFRFATAKDCPELKISKATWIRRRGLRPHPGDMPGYEVLRHMISQGQCVVRKDVTLADADVIIASGHSKIGKSAPEANFNLFADTLTANSIRLYDNRTGELEEMYRSTEVTGYIPFAPLLFAFNLTNKGNAIGLRPGFTRLESILAGWGRADLNRFLFETLQLNLDLSDPETHE